MNVRMQHRFFQNFCRLLHELSYKSQSDNAWRSKNKCGALGWPCFNQSWHHWMFRMWVKQLLKKIVNVPELCFFFLECIIHDPEKLWGGSSTTAARASRTSTAATAALRTGDLPVIGMGIKKNIIRIKKKSLGSKKNIRIKKYSPWFNSSVFKFAVIFRGNLSKSHGDFMKVMDVEQRLQRSFWDGMSYGIS